MEQEIDRLVLDINVKKNKSVTAIKDVVSAVDALKTSLSSVEQSLNKFSTIVNKIGTVNKIKTESLKNKNKEWSENVKIIDKLGNAYIKSSMHAQKLNGALHKSTDYFDEDSKLIKNTTIDIDKFGNKLTTTKNFVDVNNKSLVELYSKIVLVGVAIKGTWTYLGKFVKSSNAYIENLNLFNVTFGELNEQAREFVDTYSKTLALDPSQVMRNFGVFNQIATGFGLAKEKAYDIAQTLTQLAYDASSFFNIEISESFLKFKSGLAGELEPLRAIGYALDEATLQQVAYNHGVEKSIRVMTQAEKAQIRTIAIFEQSQNIMNDLAQTLDSPANAMRVFVQQWELFKRSIGNIVVPLITKILPTMQAFVEVLTEAGNSIAKFFGYKITGARTEDMITQINNLGNAYNKLDNEIKGSLLSIDKFSVLNDDKDKEDEIDLQIPKYDALFGAIKTNVEEIKEDIRKVLPVLVTLGAVIITKSILGSITKLNKTLNKTSLIITTIIGIVTYAYTTNENFRDSINSVLGSLFNTLKLIITPIVEVLNIIIKVVGTVTSLLDKLGLLNVAVYGTIGYLALFKTTLGVGVVSAVKKAILWLMNLKLTSLQLTKVIGVAGLLGSFMAVSLMLNSLQGDSRKIASGITLITSAIVGLSMALLAMKGIMTWGTAIPILLASVGAGIAGLQGMFSSVDGFANGGFTNANLIKTNENGLNEWVGKQGNSNVIVNDKQMDEIMASAVERGTYNAIAKANGNGNGQDLVLKIDGRELARSNVSNVVDALNSNYNVEIRPR